MAAKKDKTKCARCQHGDRNYGNLCRDCYERGVARNSGSGHDHGNRRDKSMKENTYETKWGTGHG